MNTDFFNTIFGGTYTQVRQQPQPQATVDAYAEMLCRAQQSAGTRLTPEIENAMMIRRCGNLCQDASAAGWKVKRLRGNGLKQFVFILPNGREVRGPANYSERAALVLAVEQLAPYL